ncbi:MAG: hypothetical protein HOI80_02605 [Alphaproteobacteria bacterium]|nr:hypothetical protein [Alphaproteobacteria bacterium]
MDPAIPRLPTSHQLKTLVRQETLGSGKTIALESLANSGRSGALAVYAIWLSGSWHMAKNRLPGH